MDPFTQRMLERARARQEKIDQKLANSGQTVPKRKPLAENVTFLKTGSSPVKSPSKTCRDSVLSPKKSLNDSTKSPNRLSTVKNEQTITSPRRTIQKTEKAVASPQKARNDIIVTRKEFHSPRNSKGGVNRRSSDVSVEINIMHRDDIQIEVQVEERDAPISVTYDSDKESGVKIEEIHEKDTKSTMRPIMDAETQRTEKGKLRQDVKSRLDRLGNLYSDKPTLSSPIHRTEQKFTSATPPQDQRNPPKKPAPDGKRKFGRLAALANEINNWEDDLTHHQFNPEPVKKGGQKPDLKKDLEASTLDVSIHSLNDINKVLQTNSKTKAQAPKAPVNNHTFTKPATKENQQLNKNIVAELEGEGYRRVSATQSRLVYDFTTETADCGRQEPKPASTSTTPSCADTSTMATLVANVNPPITKKPSIKKYKAPTPPRKVINECASEKDKENNVLQTEDNRMDDATDCKQTKDDKPVENSPVLKRLAPKLNGNVDRSSVLSKAAMFEAGSPKAKDPAEMSLRERKALFEKNKGAAIVPKAPFGLAPSVKTLHGDANKDKPKLPPKPSAPTKSSTSSTSSKDSDDNISQSSLGGGIRGKLAALFNKEQTISEATIANKFKQEREREMEMLQNRFYYKTKEQTNESDDEQSIADPSEVAPLMGSTPSLAQANKKPEIIANIPKVKEGDDEVAQPVKRRSSEDSPVVLSVLEDAKRVKVNNKEEPNGTVTQQPNRLYPNLAGLESQEEFSDCGGSSTDNNVDDPIKSDDNWAETSFSREVMNVVKKNNTSYKKAVASDSDESGAYDSELDELLDEAMEEEGPTPPKQKAGSLSSNSFVYQEQKKFKSPLKVNPLTPAPSTPRDKGAELVHSVSFYRRMQNASSTPTTPMRLIRHTSPEREVPATSDETTVMTVRQRIKQLQNEVAKQQTVISQASQALNLCASTIEFSGSTEQAEGERLLLLATHRRQACLHEVQRLQVEGAGAAASPGMACLAITSLTLPLRRDYIRHLNADGAVGHHAVCLLKCRDRVLATSMPQTLPSSNILHFPDEIRMEGITSDFKVTVEVYLLQASKEVLPHNVKYHIFSKKSNSKMLTPKSKVSELKTPRVQSPAGPTAVRTPQFQLHGYCIFALSQATRKNFTLSKIPHGSPLEGSIQLEIAAQVVVPAPAPHAAFLTAFEDVSGLGAWHRRWFTLRPPTLSYWKYPDDVNVKMPIGDIDLTTVISEKVTKAPRDLCARPNTLLVETTVPMGLKVPETGSLVYVKRSDGKMVRRHLLAADTQKDRDEWLECLNKALEYVRCIYKDDD